MTRHAILLIALNCATSGVLRGQEPFTTLNIAFGFQYDINPTLLHKFWMPGAGIGINAATPVQRGVLEFGAALHRFNRKADVPGFGAFWLYAGWGVRWQPQNRIRLGSSIRLGNYRMSFDAVANDFPGTTTESEFITGLDLHASFRLTRTKSIYGSLTTAQIRTSPRITLWFGSVGLHMVLAMPELLRKLLR